MDFDSIPAGVDFREQIKQTIERSNLVIAVIGPDWLGERAGSRRIDESGDFVRLEIAYALNRGIPVIPLLVDDTPMPKAETLPPDIAALAFRNALPLDSGIDFHSHTDRLIVGIRRALTEARPRGQTRGSGSEHSAASWSDRRRAIAIWCGSIVVAFLAFVGIWRFIASGSAERAERERILEHDKTAVATLTPSGNPSPSPPTISPKAIISTPAQVPEPLVSRTAQPITTAPPTPEPTLESRLIGKWQGPRHMIEYFPDHTFAQTGLKVDGMTWRLDGQVLTVVYPDLGKDFPAWYPEPGPLTLKIVSLGGGELITENAAGLQFVEYRITVDTPDEREGAATRAKAETKKRQANQTERSSPTATRTPQGSMAPTIQRSVASTATPAIDTAPSQAPPVTAIEPSNEILALVYVAKIRLNVLLPTALFPDAATRFGDEHIDHLDSVKGCAAVSFHASRDSVKNVYERYLKEVPSQNIRKTIDYKVLRTTWFVLSGSSQSTGFYIKGTKRGEEVAVMELEYNGTVCNIPASALTEISQKFNGTSQAATPTPFATSQTPYNESTAHDLIGFDIEWPTVYGLDSISDPDKGLVDKFEVISGNNGSRDLSTLKTKGRMMRSHIENADFDLITNWKTGDSIQLFNGPRYYVLSKEAEMQKVIENLKQEYYRVFGKKGWPLPHATNRTVKIAGGHVLEEYVSEAKMGKYVWWISRELAPFVALHYRNLDHRYDFQNPAYSSLPGMPVVQMDETRYSGDGGVGLTKQRRTLLSIGMETLPDSQFQVPPGYRRQ